MTTIEKTRRMQRSISGAGMTRLDPKHKTPTAPTIPAPSLVTSREMSLSNPAIVLDPFWWLIFRARAPRQRSPGRRRVQASEPTGDWGGWIMPIDAEAWSQRVEKSRVRTVHDAAALRTYLLSSAAGGVAGGVLALTMLRWHGLLRESKTIAGSKDARYSRVFIVTTSVCCGFLLAGNYARLVIHPPHAEQRGTLVQGRTNKVALDVREQS